MTDLPYCHLKWPFKWPVFIASTPTDKKGNFVCNLEGYCGISTSTQGEMTKRKPLFFH